jgi:hypothetical protein
MSAIYPLSVHRQIERRWAERIKSISQLHDRLIDATERTFQQVLNSKGPLIAVPVKSVVNRRGAKSVRTT